jgi:RNA polymerase sigma-70 factor (ECF subfamily)
LVSGGATVERLTDEKLMEFLRRGDTRALDELYRRHARKIFALFRSVAASRSPEDCEDAVHDVFMRVVRGAETFDPGKASFRTWISRIARNHSIDLMRRGEKVKTVAIGDASEVEAYGSGVIPETELADQGEGAEAAMIRKATAEAVRDCIGQLDDPDEKQAIVFYYLYDKVYREIGDILGESTSMARNRIKTAQAKIRECLENKGVTGW